MAKIHLKVEFDGVFRRVLFPADVGQQGLKALQEWLAGLFHVESPDELQVLYKDEEGDLVTMWSDSELRSLVDQATSQADVVRLNLVRKHSSPRVDSFPHEKLAKELCDPACAAQIQSLFTSPKLGEVIAQAANVYIRSKGNIPATLSVLHKLVPLFLSLLEELGDKWVTIKPLHKRLEQHYQCKLERATPPLLRRAHFNILCTGCHGSCQLRQISSKCGHINPRGFIRGLRFKSLTKENMNLCESCKNSADFPEVEFGPFRVFEPEPRGCRGRGRGKAMKLGLNPTRDSTAELRWCSQLDQLKSLGFPVKEQNALHLRILEEEKGNMERVVARLVTESDS